MPADREPEIDIPDAAPPGPFVYADTGIIRADIQNVAATLAGGTVAIVGAGGTGSVVLDLLCKTPVERIIVIDGDRAEQHNAFRWPGAMALEELSDSPFKVDYFARVYGRMHLGIAPFPEHLQPSNLAILDGVDFVFVCVDSIEARKFLIPELEARNLPFIDAGLGLTLSDDQLIGLVRVTTSTPTARAHVHNKSRIPLAGSDDDDLYRSNIQVADLNMLAGVLAIIQYKQLRGFYHDSEAEYHTIYATDANYITNEDRF